MTNRIGGSLPPPEPTRGPRGQQSTPGSDEFAKKMKPVEKIEKVGEVDLDQQRKRQFPTTEDEDEDALGGDEGASSSSSSTQASGSSQASGLENLENQTIPTPDISPTPLNGSSFSSYSVETDEDLPQSEGFWGTYNMPDQPSLPTSFEENTQNSVPSGRQNESQSEQARAAQARQTKNKKTQKLVHGTQLFSEEKKKQNQIETFRSPLSLQKEKKKEGLPPPPFFSHQEKKRKAEEETPAPFGLIGEHHQSTFQEKNEGSKKKKQDVEAVSKIPDPLPPNIHQIAQEVKTEASSYLNTNTASLFIRMVGTIMYMTSATPGISRTEITLNTPAFEKSIFFGTKITIDQYSSAPDSFNIRLSGSPAAVKIFDENMPNLMAAFNHSYETQKVRFRIGRIEIAQMVERPLIRRKGTAGDKGSA